MTDIEKELERFIASGEATISIDNSGFQTTHIDPLKIAKHFAQWQREQMMNDAVECHIDYYDGPNLDFTQKQLDDALEKIGAGVGDKVKLIIVKDND